MLRIPNILALTKRRAGVGGIENTNLNFEQSGLTTSFHEAERHRKLCRRPVISLTIDELKVRSEFSQEDVIKHQHPTDLLKEQREFIHNSSKYNVEAYFRVGT